MSNDHPDARQERIDATARGIYEAGISHVSPEISKYSLEALISPDRAYGMAIALEAARERALLKEAKP